MTDAAATKLDVARLRADFPILATLLHQRDDRPGVPLVYLDNGASTQHPRQVIQTIAETYERYYANVHRGIHWLSEQCTDRYEEARRKVRTFIGAAAEEEIIFTRGTTESINLVARSWGDANLRPGDEILLTEMEHHSNIVPWQQAAERTGAKIRWLPITDDGQLQLDRLDAFVSPRTKLVAVTAVSNVLGTVNHLEPIIAAAQAVARWSWSMRPKARRIKRPTFRRRAWTFSHSADTRCWGPAVSACCTVAESCWKRCRPSWAEEA